MPPAAILRSLQAKFRQAPVPLTLAVAVALIVVTATGIVAPRVAAKDTTAATVVAQEAATPQDTTDDTVTRLLATGKTVLGQTIAYPTQGAAKVTAVIVTMQPGATTGWHRHDVPMFGYLLEGEITVDYGPHGTRVYRQGDAVMEAIDLAHDGRNSGSGAARILAVFIGADGVPDTVKAAPPEKK